MLSMIALHSSSTTNTLAPSECLKPANELSWQVCSTLLKWLILWYWTSHKVLSIYSCFATKLHWHPCLEVRPAYNLLAFLYFVYPIGSSRHVRLLEQLVLELVPRNYGCACIHAPTPSLIDFSSQEMYVLSKGPGGGICNLARRFSRVTSRTLNISCTPIFKHV